MSKHPLIGKLCQYKSEHRDKVLFTFSVSEEELKEIKFSMLIWDDSERITANTMIPSWYYQKYIEYRRHKQEICPDPTTYHTPYAVKPHIPFDANEKDAEIKNFLVIDIKRFITKIGKIVAGERVMLKILYANEDGSNTFWVDEKWIEPSGFKGTYLEDLKSRMLNKLRQNT
jgi:hypothetical protein